MKTTEKTIDQLVFDERTKLFMMCAERDENGYCTLRVEIDQNLFPFVIYQLLLIHQIRVLGSMDKVGLIDVLRTDISQGFFNASNPKKVCYLAWDRKKIVRLTDEA